MIMPPYTHMSSGVNRKLGGRSVPPTLTSNTAARSAPTCFRYASERTTERRAGAPDTTSGCALRNVIHSQQARRASVWAEIR